MGCDGSALLAGILFLRKSLNAAETEPLVGMSLLYGYRMQLDAIESGIVVIQSLNSLS